VAPLGPLQEQIQEQIQEQLQEQIQEQLQEQIPVAEARYRRNQPSPEAELALQIVQLKADAKAVAIPAVVLELAVASGSQEAQATECQWGQSFVVFLEAQLLGQAQQAQQAQQYRWVRSLAGLDVGPQHLSAQVLQTVPVEELLVALDFAGQLAGGAASAPASAFVFHDCDEWLLAQDHTRDT
jgi:hypothetical protein